MFGILKKSRIAHVSAGLLLVPTWAACASHEWEVMPKGFQTQASMQPDPGSTAAGLFKIETETSGELGTSVRILGLEPRQRYFLRFRIRPTCAFEAGSNAIIETPRTRPANTPEHAYASFLGRFPAFVADEHGEAVVSAKIAGYLGIDWQSLSAVLYRGDVDLASASQIACGRFGTVKIETNR